MLSVYAFSIDFATVTWIIHRSHQAGKRAGDESVLIETLMWPSSEHLEQPSGFQAHPSGSAMGLCHTISNTDD